MVLSPEQLEIIYLDEDCDVYVQAYAGSGKTTVLREFSIERPFSPILYLVFNRHNRFEAKKSFPPNVTIHTVNSFVYKNLNLKNILNFLPPSFIEKKFRIDDYSLALEIAGEFERVMNFPNTDSLFMDRIEEIYLSMKNREIPFTQSAAMRFFCEKHSGKIDRYEYVLVDEAQDVNPLFQNILDKIEGKKIFVGDPYQSIYGFRNNINLFSEIPENAVKKTLRRSFRFGKKYAKSLNNLCHKMYGSTFFIKGNEDRNTKILSSYPSCDNVVHIARTNSHIFEKAFFAAKEGKKIAIPLDLDEMRDIVFDVFYIKSGMFYKVQKLKGINSYERCKAVGKYEKNIGIATRIVDKFGIEIFSMFDAIRNSLTNWKFADAIFYTAHKSKGLEFENVVVEDDFNAKGADMEEKNLFYMAATRVKESIYFARKNSPGGECRNSS